MPPTSFSSLSISLTQGIISILILSLRYVSVYILILETTLLMINPSFFFALQNIELLVLYYCQLSAYGEHRN